MSLADHHRCVPALMSVNGRPMGLQDAIGQRLQQPRATYGNDNRHCRWHGILLPWLQALGTPRRAMRGRPQSAEVHVCDE